MNGVCSYVASLSLHRLPSQSSAGLCTIEAVYFFMQELQQANMQKPCEAAAEQYDNLLWYFAYEHQVVCDAFAAKKRKREEREPDS